MFCFKNSFSKNRNEWQVVTKSSGKEVKSIVNGGGGGGGSSGKNKCYFRMSINGVMSEKIIIQLEQAKAPIMCAKFIDMCTRKNGYQGSKIFKVMPTNRFTSLVLFHMKCWVLTRY